MSRHVPRSRRWRQSGPAEHRWDGAVVRPYRGAWYAWLTYRLAGPPVSPDGPPAAEQRCDRLGPFKRPRNAMIAAEQHALDLTRRHGEGVTFIET
jgi:hypothetical protein